MTPKLDSETITAIRTSRDGVCETARRLGVSVSTVSKYRPRRRKHLNHIERDAVFLEFLAGVPTAETARRYGICRETVQTIRRAGAKLLDQRAA
jgi:DNA-directed RNA polymerase specialized sigma24 family protein